MMLWILITLWIVAYLAIAASGVRLKYWKLKKAEAELESYRLTMVKLLSAGEAERLQMLIHLDHDVLRDLADSMHFRVIR